MIMMMMIMSKGLNCDALQLEAVRRSTSPCGLYYEACIPSCQILAK